MRLAKTLTLAVFVSAALVIPTMDAQIRQSTWNGQEKDTYRFGSTYKVGASHDASQCQIACFNDEACKAWSFKPAAGLAPGTCELKRNVGQPMTVPGASAGIAGYLDQLFTGHRAVWTDTQATAQGSNVPDLGGRSVVSLAGGANSDAPWPNPGGTSGNGLFHISQPFAHQLKPNLWIPSINHPGSYEVGGYYMHNQSMATRAPLPKDQVIQLLTDSQPERRGGPLRQAEIYIPPAPQPVIPSPTSQVSQLVGQSMPSKTSWPVQIPKQWQPTTEVGAVRQDLLQGPQVQAYAEYHPRPSYSGPGLELAPTTNYYAQPQSYAPATVPSYIPQQGPIYAYSSRISPITPGPNAATMVAPPNPALSNFDSATATKSSSAETTSPQAAAQIEAQATNVVARQTQSLPQVNSLNLIPVPTAQLPGAPVTTKQSFPPQAPPAAQEFYPNRQAGTPDQQNVRTDFFPNAPTNPAMADTGSSNFYPNRQNTY